MSCIYIKKNVKGYYVELPEELSVDLYNNLGFTYSDYLNNKWVKLSDEQILFKNEHPHANIKEVWDMSITSILNENIGDIKNEIINNILEYDLSENVNSFIVNNDIIGWFTVEERSNYKQSIEAAKLLGIEKLSFFINDIKLEITTEIAEHMLALIQLYADECFMVTKQHELNVRELRTIEDLRNFNFSGYPIL